MYIWYVSLYEPLPFGGEGIRKMRSGLLTDALVADGHDVELWIPGFEHVHLKQYKVYSEIERVADRFSIQYIRGPGYRKDTSYKRLFHNRAIAKEFKELALSKGFLIVSSSPLTRSSYHADEDFSKMKKLRVKQAVCHPLQ